MFKEYPAHDATGLAELVARREISAVELLDAALARLDEVNPKINAFCAPMIDAARQRANGPLSGPFAGVPFLIKDIAQNVAGVPTSAGSRVLKDWRPDVSSEIVLRFERAGLVSFGKTTTPELALKGCTESLLFGATRNPWNLSRTPGGSSGGAAAAVAAGIVPVASASDGGGSIRIPASYCGLFGLRPGRGRVPPGPSHDEFWEGASSEHVLSHTVRDSARMLDAIHGADQGSPFRIAAPERPYAEEVGRDPGRLRIGFSTASPINQPVDLDCVRAVHETAKLLESLGHHVEEASPEIDGEALARCYLTMYYGQTAATVDHACELSGANESAFELDTRALAAFGRSLTAGEYVASRQRWNDFLRAMGRFHSRFDLYLTPTVAQPAAGIGAQDTPLAERIGLRAVLKLGLARRLLDSGVVDKIAAKSLGRVPFTQLSNLTFTPSMSVPLASFADGMPLGVQFVAATGGEGLLIRLASQLEQAQPWAGRRAVI
ncbi:amidase [uncultured Nevskia sp.]|uniref:amidase n=1 Tax=uncultured Nevskia sp. TaxID=228950 RepID=UPI0025D623BE|nr:amidase [uncultured Nevskia sp.]